MAIVYQPEPDDVLCGRGENSFRHKGNYYFRQLIVENSCRYKMAATRKQKSQVVLQVAYAIIERGGRFLIRSDDGKSWRDGGLHRGKLKAGHSFRDAARGRFKTLEGLMRRAQARRDRKFGAKKQTYDNPTNVVSLETNSSFSLPSIYNTIEPSKEWKTAAFSIDTELANDLLNLFYISESHDADRDCGSCLTQSMRASQVRRDNEDETNERSRNEQISDVIDSKTGTRCSISSPSSIYSTVEPSKDWKTASIDAELANYVRSVFCYAEATTTGSGRTM